MCVNMFSRAFILVVIGVFAAQTSGLVIKNGRDENKIDLVYTEQIGKFRVSMDDPLSSITLVNYKLSQLESVLISTYNTELEQSLNDIYKICGKNRLNYVPYKKIEIELSEQEALTQAKSILFELQSLKNGSFVDKYGLEKQLNKTSSQYSNRDYTYTIYPNVISNFTDLKRLLNFKFTLSKLSGSEALISVSVPIPQSYVQSLNKIHYIPIFFGNYYKEASASDIMIPKDTSVNTFFRMQDYYRQSDVYLVKDIGDCNLVNSTFFCDNSTITSAESTCIQELRSRSYGSVYKNEKLDEVCVLEDGADQFTDLTYLGDNKYFYVFLRKAHYRYECEDSSMTTGLIEPKYGWGGNFGMIELDVNCNFTIANAKITGTNGVFKLKVTDDADLLELDFQTNRERIWGIPFWTFIGICAGLIVFALILVIICLCKCIRWCKSKNGIIYSGLMTGASS